MKKDTFHMSPALRNYKDPEVQYNIARDQGQKIQFCDHCTDIQVAISDAIVQKTKLQDRVFDLEDELENLRDQLTDALRTVSQYRELVNEADHKLQEVHASQFSPFEEKDEPRPHGPIVQEPIPAQGSQSSDRPEKSASPIQTAMGKDLSSPLMVVDLPKIQRDSNSPLNTGNTVSTQDGIPPVLQDANMFNLFQQFMAQMNQSRSQ